MNEILKIARQPRSCQIRRRILMLAGLGLLGWFWAISSAASFGLESSQGPGRDGISQTVGQPVGDGQDRALRPPGDGQSHKILVVDGGTWGFIAAHGNNPTHLLSQTQYKLGENDWAVWGKPIQNGIDNFYTLIIVRPPPAGVSFSPGPWLTRPTAGDGNRRNSSIEANWRAYWQSMADPYPTGRGWNFRQSPQYSLLNVIRPTPQDIVYEADPDLDGGQAIIKSPGSPGVDHEFQLLTEIGGVAVDRQAIGGWTIRTPQSVLVAIGVDYTRLESIPEWQRPILAQLAGIDPEDWEYVDYIMYRESTWRPLLKNKSSGAYGVCQSLPADKMATAGDDYLTNPLTQLEWCHDYAQQRYGSWSQAYDFWIRNYWW